MTNEFIVAWRAWIRADTPTENFHLGRSGVPTYGVELELDHLLSQVYSLGAAAIAGTKWRWRELTREELANLDRIDRALVGTAAVGSQRRRLDDSIRLTRRVLNALAELEGEKDREGAAPA